MKTWLCGAAGSVLALLLLHGAETMAQVTQASGPPVPYEDIGACPFEGCVYREWIANAPLTVGAFFCCFPGLSL